ncbi:MAG: zf-HC2 domain-containing protein [Pyrinomonadaceae bacterium]
MSVTEHLTGEAIELYRTRRSSAAETLAAQHHVAGCADCRARLAAAVEADAALPSLRKQMAPAEDDAFGADSHLSYEQLSLYVDGGLDEVEREIADSHLSFCEDCAADLADLRQYARLAASAEPTPAARPARDESPSFWRRFAALLGSFARPLPATAAAALVLITLGGVWLATRDGVAPPVDESARVRPETNQAPTPAVAPEQKNVPSPTPPPVETSSAPIVDNSGRPSPSPAPPAIDAPRAPSNVAAPGINPAPPASELVALNDGGSHVTLDRRGRLKGLEGAPPDARLAVSRALRSRSIETASALNGLAEDEGDTLMGRGGTVGASFALRGPVGKVVRETRPALSWSPLAGARSYTVAVVDSKFTPVAQSRALNQTSWTTDAALARGAVYSWQVTATLEDGTQVTAPAAPAPQARFRVLDAEAHDRLTRLEKAAPNSRLARGVAYAQAGLLDEAEAELKELLKENPRSQVARDLLRSLRQPSRPKRALP